MAAIAYGKYRECHMSGTISPISMMLESILWFSNMPDHLE
jgi:hypothetical protein